MKQYLILQYPGHNRVYYNLADKLALAELRLSLPLLSEQGKNPKITEIGGVRYLSFESEKELTKKDLSLLSRLSFVFAIYEYLVDGGRDVLHPLLKCNDEYLDSKISSLLKYPGKTNELFTKMMINVAYLSSDFIDEINLNLLDPVAGRGTTLYEATVLGYNAYGIELEPKSVHDSSIFFKKFLQNEGVKHKYLKKQVAGKSKLNAIYMEEFKYAKTKEEFKNEASTKTLGIVGGDTKEADSYFKKNTFHFIVGDLPYGIFHGNSSSSSSKSKTRNPSHLIKDCLVGWKKVLKCGGCIVLAWNSFLVSRKQLAQLFLDNGYEVLDSSPYDEFEHMVDKSIKRDIIVAKRMK